MILFLHSLSALILRACHSCCAPLPLASVVLEIEDCVSWADTLLTSLALALRAQKLLPEGLVVTFLRRLLDNDCLPVVADLVDDPFGGFAELKFVESGDAVGRDGDTGSEQLKLALAQ